MVFVYLIQTVLALIIATFVSVPFLLVLGIKHSESGVGNFFEYLISKKSLRENICCIACLLNFIAAFCIMGYMFFTLKVVMSTLWIPFIITSIIFTIALNKGLSTIIWCFIKRHIIAIILLITAIIIIIKTPNLLDTVLNLIIAFVVTIPFVVVIYLDTGDILCIIKHFISKKSFRKNTRCIIYLLDFIVSFCILESQLFTGKNVFVLLLIPFVIASCIYFILTDKIWYGTIDFIQKHIIIPILLKSRMENEYGIVEMTNSDLGVNIVYYKKSDSDVSDTIKQSETKIENHVIYLLRSIDTPIDLVSYFTFLYDKYKRSDELTAELFVQIAEKRKFLVRSYLISGSIDESMSISTLLKKNNMDLTQKILNINDASEDEITNLPFINVIISKKIIQYRYENNEFKSFWEFVDFLGLKNTQAQILAKLIEVKPSQNTDMQKDVEITNAEDKRIVDL